jgi:hypothetical protein
VPRIHGKCCQAAEKRAPAQRPKEFLISQAVEQAQGEKVPLSKVERKMLYFTETQETLPDIYEVDAEFDSKYDRADYEKKIAGLLRNAHRRIRKESFEGERHWKQAIADLRREDHDLLVTVDCLSFVSLWRSPCGTTSTTEDGSRAGFLISRRDS